MKPNISFLFSNLLRFTKGKSPKSLVLLQQLFAVMEDSIHAMHIKELHTLDEATRLVLAEFKRAWLLLDNSSSLYPLLAKSSFLHREMYLFHQSLQEDALEDLRQLMRLYILDANIMHSKLVA